jgi:hypothetical protein
MADEMERVCHEQTIERRQFLRLRKVSGKVVDGHAGEMGSHRALLLPQGSSVPVD